MRSYGSTLSCALTLISTISAAALPLDTVSDLVSDLTSNPAALGSVIPTVVTDVVSSSPVADALSAASEVASEVKTSKEGSVLASTVSSVASSAPLKISKAFPSDIFPDFLQSTILTCKFGDSVVSGLSDLIGISSKEAGSAPTCSTSSSLMGNYILIMIDPDAINPQHVHYLQTDLACSNGTSKNSSSYGRNILSTTVSPVLEYADPSLPLGTGLHRFTTFLFPQPGEFSLNEEIDREDFDIVDFASEHKLGLPVGATFFAAAENLTGDLKGNFLSGNLTNALLGNLTHSLLGNLTNGLLGNFTKLLNGTLLDSILGNRTNTTLLGSSLFGNGTHGNSTFENGHNSTGSGTSNTKDEKTSTGPIPVSPTSKANSDSVSTEDNLSTGGSSAVIANFALAGFVGMVTVGVAYL